MKAKMMESLRKVLADSKKLAPGTAQLRPLGPNNAWAIESKPGPLTLRSGRTLEIRISGTKNELRRFKISYGLPGDWRICFHRDPEQQDWPRHPLHHIHLEYTHDPGPGPWTKENWRIPFGETEPDRLVEYLLHLEP